MNESKILDSDSGAVHGCFSVGNGQSTVCVEIFLNKFWDKNM